MTKKLFVLFLILSFALASCNIKSTQKVKIYKGYYWYNFEESRFSRLCRTELWWMTESMDEVIPFILKHINNPKTQKSVLPIYLEVKAKVSSKGKWGHLGSYSREITVIEVLFFSKTNKHRYKNYCDAPTLE